MGEVVQLAPGVMKRIGEVHERYQSFNIEMLEVTGGRFWKPYSSMGKAANSDGAAPGGEQGVPAGMDPNLYEYRAPIDLTNRRLRLLAKALAPAFLRISGTWANSTYFAEGDNPPAAAPGAAC
jgi:heparanase 1